ncbi:NUDIX domain-containing protein [Oceanicoccus sagamiensis]|uniref:GDP-mannose pyrophosphatase n=1 Tax=Oceanicoccus sagamiensis TaxID=716816 RepID=A0A1X9NEE7_9GAMM|nr:NUDIX hydrolase [Oceanicoccus sagamiensis]ARN74802.1 DNA mismatch repair protein MutT [Oceanicoccus sagamiensis]
MSDDNSKPVKVGPWQRKTQTLVYENPWIALTHEEVVTPAGSDGIYGKVHFKNRAIGIIPLDENNHTVLVGQYRYALDEYSWEIPMGGGALTEEPLQSAQRELLEETGLQGGNWQQLFKLHTSNSVTDEQGYVFLARNLVQGEQALEDTESDLVLKHLSFSEAIAMVEEGAITDVISIAGLLAVEKILKQ